MVRAARSSLNLQSGNIVVIGDSGLTGTIAEVPDDRSVLIRIGDELQGSSVRHIKAPVDEIRRLADGTLHLPLPHEQVQRLQRERGAADASGRMVIPLAEERLHVDRRTVLTGRVVVDKTVSERQETVNEPVVVEQADVRTVAVHKIIDEPAEIREEGDELVVPLMEEVLVVEKRLMLREEIRISRKRTERHEPRAYTLQREEAKVQRVEEPSTSQSNADQDPNKE